MTETHVHTLLGGYTLGILDADEIRAVDEHIESCAECRDELAAVTEATALLALLPADEARSLVASEPGPQDALPAEDDLVLRRTLRAVRAERSGQQMRRLTLVAAGVAVLVGIGAATGFLAGNQSSEVSGAQPTLTATPAPSTQGAVPPSLPPGAKILTASDSGTGVGARATVVPAAGWVRLGVKVTGVNAGEHCQLIAISKSGSREVAGSWVVSAKGSAPGAAAVQGSAAIAPADLAALEVVTTAGKRLVTLPV